MSLFSFITDIKGCFEIPTLPPPPPFIKFNKNLRPPPRPSFIRHLRVHDLQHEILQKSNHLQELFFIFIFLLDILNHERNQ